MYQNIDVGPPSTLYWDMQYRSHCPRLPQCATVFDPANHYIAVRIRDSSSDALLDTLWITDSSKPQVNPAHPQLTRDYSVNLAAYAGRTVRLSVEIQVTYFLDAQLDNFRLVANPPPAPPVVVPPVVVPPVVVPPVVVPPTPLVGEEGEQGQHGELGNMENSGATPK
jgi:hypothetical protein